MKGSVKNQTQRGSDLEAVATAIDALLGVQVVALDR